METFKEVCCTLGRALVSILLFSAKALVVVLQLTLYCAMFFFVGFGAGRMLNSDD